MIPIWPPPWRPRFPGVHVIQGDAFDLARTLGARDSEPFAGIVSGLPLLNFPMAAPPRLDRRRAGAGWRPGRRLIQFSYGMHAPVVPPPGYRVICAALVWANLPPAAGLGVPEDLRFMLHFMLQQNVQHKTCSCCSTCCSIDASISL